MDNLDELMGLAEVYVGPVMDELYLRLLKTDYSQDDPQVVMLTAALATNSLGNDNRGDRPTKVLLMATWGEQGILNRPSLSVMRWRKRALSGRDLANEPAVGTARTYQPGKMPFLARPRLGLRSRHQAFNQEMSSKAASSSSQLKAAVPAKRARVEEELQTSETMEGLNETRYKLYRVRKTSARTKKNTDMWRRLFEDGNKKEGEEMERLRQVYKEQSERLGVTKTERPLPSGSVPRGKSLMERLLPREQSQTTEVPTGSSRVTIPDPCDTLGDPVVEKTMRQLVEAAGRLVANRSMPGSRVTAPCGTIDDTGRVEISSEVVQKTGAATMTKSAKNSTTKIREMAVMKVSRVLEE